MPNYKRSKTGHVFFFTVVTWKRRPLFHDPENRLILGQIIRKVRDRYPFGTEAFVLLPDHLHCIWRLPDSDYSRRWAVIKKEFTQKLDTLPGTVTPENLKQRNEGMIWQRRFWEHTIRDDSDFENHCHYIHHNPVKHGYVQYPHQWEFSSFHRFVKKGLYQPHWCATETIFEGMDVDE